MSTPDERPKTIPPIGNLLAQAGLITDAQIQVILQDQSYNGLRFGEILVLRGWIKPETVDFLVDQWPQLLDEEEKEKLGHCLLKAGLLNESQVKTILKEQWQNGLRFGAVAVLNGWIKQETVDFFLESLAPERRTEPPYFHNPQRPIQPVVEPTPQPAPDPVPVVVNSSDQELVDEDLDLDNYTWKG